VPVICFKSKEDEMKTFSFRYFRILVAVALTLGLVPILSFGASAQEPAWDPIALPFRDDFEGSLATNWQITNPNSAKYSLSENPDSLRTYTTGTDTWLSDNSLANLFSVKIPEGTDQLVVTAKLSFPVLPYSHAQQGGIILLADSNGKPDLDNYYRATYGYFDGVRSTEAMPEINGSAVAYRGSRLEIGTAPIWLMIVKSLDTYAAYYSVDGINYNQYNTVTASFNIVYVGLAAFSVGSIPVDFDFIEVNLPLPIPTVTASPQADWVKADGWSLDTEVALTIDGTAGFYTTTAVMGPASWNPDVIVAEFNLNGFDIQAGDILTVTAQGVSKILTISSMQMNDVNLQNDTVFGTAAPGTEIEVCAHSPNDCIRRFIIVNSSGNWTAEYGIEGIPPDDPDTFDIQPGSVISASVEDGDGDTTWIDWYLPNPIFSASPQADWVTADGWPLGTEVALTIDGAAGFYTTTKVMGPASWNPDMIVAEFDLNGYDIQAGDLLTVTAQGISKVLTISSVQVNDINLQSDTASGTAAPGTAIDVCAHASSPDIHRFVQADSLGNWVAEFGVEGIPPDDPATFDIRPGSVVSASVYDDDGDRTLIDWYVPKPRIDARANNDWVEGYDWEVGAILTLEINDPDTSQEPDYAATGVVEIAFNPADYSYIEFRFRGIYDLKPGDEVTLTDGITPKATVVTSVAITSIDPVTDIVTGEAEPGSPIHVNACDMWYCPTREEVTNEFGHWTSDFSDPSQPTFDIVPGTWVDAGQTDDDGDNTMFGWDVPDLPYTPFVAFGQEGVWIKENSNIASGDVGANVASNGPYLTDQSEVTIGQGVHILNPDSRVLGNTVYLKQGSQVYDIYTNQLKGDGQILGVVHTPLELPLFQQLPAVPGVTPGTQNFDLKKNATLTLNAGSYGKLETKKGATITFTGGVYHFTEWSLGDNIKVYFSAPTEIRIADKLDIGSDAIVAPASGTQLTASDILIYVLGQNGKNGKINASPKAAKFGTRAIITANVYTPNGTLWIHERSTATGAFFGKWVEIGQNVTLTLDNGWH
jgi:hypothetical protein